ncbi:MAG: hypothetical protein HQM15_01790 [Deltaproteobacteria bacterium]|nr:hypothetical protein [Deltaproteobacteria bacterium]
MFKKTLAVFTLGAILAFTSPACKKKEVPEEGINSEGAVAPTKAPVSQDFPKIQGSVVPAAPVIPPPPPSGLNMPPSTPAVPGSMPSSVPSNISPPPPPPPPAAIPTLTTPTPPHPATP